MLDFISGKVVSINPADVVILNNGIGYKINITLSTFDVIKNQTECQLFTHLRVVNEGQNISGFALYGFATPDERAYFEVIIGVSGIGASTARLMLSSLKPSEIATAVAIEDVNRITSVKGIGPKTAKRLILELKDKLGKVEIQSNSGEQIASGHNTIAEEALSALLMLGFNKTAVQKVIRDVIHKENATSVEQVVKLSLKKL